MRCSARMAAGGSAGRAEGKKIVRGADACNANPPSASGPRFFATPAAKDQAVPAVTAAEPRASLVASRRPGLNADTKLTSPAGVLGAGRSFRRGPA